MKGCEESTDNRWKFDLTYCQTAASKACVPFIADFHDAKNNPIRTDQKVLFKPLDFNAKDYLIKTIIGSRFLIRSSSRTAAQNTFLTFLLFSTKLVT